MAALIEEEGLDKDGLPEKCWNAYCQCKHKHKHKQVKKAVQGEDDDDDEDSEFASSGSGDSDESGSESDSNGSDDIIPNDEVYSSLLFFILLSPWFFRLLTCSPQKRRHVPSERNQQRAHNRRIRLQVQFNT
jgi:hypothetical protein